MAINRVFLSGKLGAKPEVLNPSAGTTMSVMRLAVSYKENTSWYTVIAFGSIAEFLVGTAQKGQTLFVEGRLDARKYTDKTGQTREGFSVIVSSAQLGREPLEASKKQPSSALQDDDDLYVPIEEDIMEQVLA